MRVDVPGSGAGVGDQAVLCGQDDLVTVGLPNSIEYYVSCAAIWKLGATPQPVSARLPAAELAAVVAGHPFGADTSHSHVAFLARKPKREAVDRLAEADHAPDEASLDGTDVYLRYPAGVQGSRLSAAQLERLLDVPANGRNWRTVAKLAELAAVA